EALGSDRIIKMKSGNYILSEWDPFFNNQPESAPRYANLKDNGNPKLAKGVTWSDDPFDGGELVLNGIKNLTIISVNDKGPAGNLIVDPRYAFVLKFVKCSNITIKNITAGHSEGGYCTGGVFEFTDSSRITITDTNMYGCGTEGLVLSNVSGMKVTSSMIYECTYDIMTVSGGKNITFDKCKFSDNQEFTLVTISGTQKISFSNCEFIDNRGEMFSVRDTTVLVSNSTFERNITEYPIKNSNNISFKECTFD
ncbi:MAG: right-handed parallel beta-helix repeat-containing protein, partial [Leptospirales bacterium]|nr:right-handed parallel beta-helix repeat-containing protein [Leptospirales bacterium]